MKNLIVLSAFVIGLFSSCAKNLNADVVKSSNWELVDWKENNMPAEAKATLKIDGDRISGKAFCNNYFGNAVLNGNAIKIEPLGSTKMACEGINQAETTFLKQLQEVNAGSLQGGKLVLKKDAQVLMVFKRIP